jgi:hypothetical protein
MIIIVTATTITIITTIARVMVTTTVDGHKAPLLRDLTLERLMQGINAIAFRLDTVRNSTY